MIESYDMLREPIAQNEFYHLYNRGTEKRSIFLDENDHERFVRLLYICNVGDEIVMRDLRHLTFSELITKFSHGAPLVAIGSYCLMPNHFHLLAKEIRPNGISRFMGKLCTAFAMYFNKKYERTGALLEGRFKSSRITNDNYLRYLFAYIHLNPVKLIEPKWKEEGIQNLKRTKEFLGHYKYSSYFDFIGKKRPEAAIVERDGDVFPEYFGDSTEFEEFVDFWLDYKNQ